MTLEEEYMRDEINICEYNDIPLGIANKRELLIFYVKINMFRFKFDLYGYALNFCVKYNLLFDRINKREDWSIICF